MSSSTLRASSSARETLAPARAAFGLGRSQLSRVAMPSRRAMHEHDTLSYASGATLSVLYLGTAKSFIERQFGGARFFAPFGKVVLGAANIQSFVGTLTAKQFEVAPRATVTCDL